MDARVIRANSLASMRSLVPEEALVLTPRGPCLGGQLNAGDQVTVIDSSGVIATTSVEEITESTDLPVRRLLTASGESLLPCDARVVGSKGVLVVSDLVDGGSESVETLAPGDVPNVGTETCLPLEGVVDTSFVFLPRENGTADMVADQVDRMLERLGVDGSGVVSDRWLHLEIPSSPVAKDGWTWADELSLLRLLTAWDVKDGEVVSARIRMDQHRLRQRLVASHVAVGLTFSTSWLPGSPRRVPSDNA